MPLNPGIAEHRFGERREVADDQVEVIQDDTAVHGSSWHATMALLGRLLIGAVFLMSGIGKLTDIAGTAAHMTKMGIPYADTLALVAGIAEVLGGISIAVGLLTRIGAFGLILFMIPTTVIFHAFWNFHGEERLPQMMNFMKNLGIIGGLATLVAFGAGRFSLGRKRRRSRVR